MALFADRKLDDTVDVEIIKRERAAFILGGNVIYFHRTTLDVTPRLAV